MALDLIEPADVHSAAQTNGKFLDTNHTRTNVEAQKNTTSGIPENIEGMLQKLILQAANSDQKIIAENVVERLRTLLIGVNEKQKEFMKRRTAFLEEIHSRPPKQKIEGYSMDSAQL